MPRGGFPSLGMNGWRSTTRSPGPLISGRGDHLGAPDGDGGRDGDNGPAVRIASNAPTYYSPQLSLMARWNSIGPSIQFYAALVAGTVATGDRVRLEVQGATLRVYRNGVLLAACKTPRLPPGPRGWDKAARAVRWTIGRVGVRPRCPSRPPRHDLAAAAISPSQINLTWTDNGHDEDGFRIERCAGRLQRVRRDRHRGATW